MPPSKTSTQPHPSGLSDRRRRQLSPSQRESSEGQSSWVLMLCALGVVFGDIGTSPLYAIKETLDPAHGIALTDANILGIMSLIFWSLIIVVSLKYVVFVLKADNHGEGGITALLAKLTPVAKSNFAPVLAIFGAGLLYGDGVITPAISVLSAVEGLEIAIPRLHSIVVPVTLGILITLFAMQSRGSGKIGNVFGPITLVWFLTLAAMGIPWILSDPRVLFAISPQYAAQFFIENGSKGFWILGSVVLCVTGAEALYADMGHFGRKSIKRGWFFIVFPCLLLNYFGQGALILQKGEAALANPFYSMVGGWFIYPIIGIATLATVIASQAMITGAFSLTQQAIQLGYLPRMNLIHTSRTTEGQIYIPFVNLCLALACCVLVYTMKSSDRLADAYGVAVTGTMVTTTILFFFVLRRLWNWSWITASLLTAVFLVVDGSFFITNIVKLEHGGWIPLAIAFVVFSMMITWKRGRLELAKQMQSHSIPLVEFFRTLREPDKKPVRVPGTAVFMTLNKDVAPSVLLQHYKHSHTLHEKIILLSIVVEHVPDVRSLERVRVTDLELGFVKVIARYGYMESPNMEEIIYRCEASGLTLSLSETSFYLGRESFMTSGQSGMWSWRKKLFIFMSKNSRSASEFFNLPTARVIEIGSQIEI